MLFAISTARWRSSASGRMRTQWPVGSGELDHVSGFVFAREMFLELYGFAFAGEGSDLYAQRPLP